jgi:hypothetical protein
MYSCLTQMIQIILNEAFIMKLISVAILMIVSTVLTNTTMHEPIREAGSAGSTITMCDLLAHPSDYNGKSVTLKATLSSGMEFSIFTDDACQPQAEKTKLVLATYGTGYQFKSTNGKKLSKLLNTKRQALVTIIGVFNDPGHNIGHQNCCSYSLQVQRLLSLEEIKTER